MPLPDRFITLGNYLFGSDYYVQKPTLLSHAFRILPLLINHFESSRSISDYCVATQNYFCLGDPRFLSAEQLNSITTKYMEASDVVEELLPNWQILFEQLIVNHIFLNHYLLAKDSSDLQDTYLSIITMYSFLQLNLLGNLTSIRTPENLVDFLSAMLRVIEHSNFSSVAVHLYRNTLEES